MSKTSVLLINLGTPNNCDEKSVRHYLKEFLDDPYVIDLPTILRKVILNFFILPFRPKQSAKAYQAIWTDEGSPLKIHTKALTSALNEALPSNYKVYYGMRYGKPSIFSALKSIEDSDNLIIIPLYPQFSDACTTSSIEEVKRCIDQLNIKTKLNIVRNFHNQPGFIEAQAKIINTNIQQKDSFILFSYHGLPERHLIKNGCLKICDPVCPQQNEYPESCYRKQCYQTTQSLITALDLNNKQYQTSFQSRLGKTPWIKPFTDQTLHDLRNKGVLDLAIACPSFVADCLETLEEIGIQAKNLWQELGGRHFQLLPCLNSSSAWVDALKNIITDIALPN